MERLASLGAQFVFASHLLNRLQVLGQDVGLDLFEGRVAVAFPSEIDDAVGCKRLSNPGVVLTAFEQLDLDRLRLERVDAEEALGRVDHLHRYWYMSDTAGGASSVAGLERRRPDRVRSPSSGRSDECP